MKLLVITSCPTGIAHTYMAAEALEQAAKAAGHEVAVETQGAAGATPFTPEQIANADALIVAADVAIRDESRFAGMPQVHAAVKRGINDPAGMVKDAETLVTQAQAAGKTPAKKQLAPTNIMRDEQSWGSHLRTWLMTGVSYMIPFVAAGGVLIALGFMFGGAAIAMKVYSGTFHGVHYAGVLNSDGSVNVAHVFSKTGIAGLMFYAGKTAFAMLVPILAGYIAFAIADRPGLVPGVVAGLLSSAIGAGFLGGLIGGLLAGAIAYYLVRIKVPSWFKGIMPVLVIPLISTLIIAFIMMVLIGNPIASATTSLTNWLKGLTGTNAILLGLLLGAMMAFDMGGPVNKVAYVFATGLLSTGTTGSYKIMAAVMVGGMVPPIALAISTVVRPKLYSEQEREAGKAAWLLGASFITEGAIPFAAEDPFRVIPSIMLGSAVAGGLSMAFKCTSKAPHGGIWVLGLIGSPLAYILALVVGALVSAAAVTGLKMFTRKPIEHGPAEPAIAPVATPSDAVAV